MYKAISITLLTVTLSACGTTFRTASIDQFPPHVPHHAVYSGPAVGEEMAYQMNDYYWQKSMGRDVSQHPYHVHAH